MHSRGSFESGCLVFSEVNTHTHRLQGISVEFKAATAFEQVLCCVVFSPPGNHLVRQLVCGNGYWQLLQLPGLFEQAAQTVRVQLGRFAWNAMK